MNGENKDQKAKGTENEGSCHLADITTILHQ